MPATCPLSSWAEALSAHRTAAWATLISLITQILRCLLFARGLGFQEGELAPKTRLPLQEGPGLLQWLPGRGGGSLLEAFFHSHEGICWIPGREAGRTAVGRQPTSRRRGVSWLTTQRPRG